MEDLFDKDITIINKYVDKEHRTKYKVSYIKGFWSSNNGISINGTQLIKNDELIAKILINDTRNEKYQKIEDFRKNQKTWTLQNDDYLIKGIVNDFKTIANLRKQYDEIMKITNISIKDYGAKELQHFTITGA